MHILDLIIFLAYMLMLLGVGLWFYRRNKSSSAFMLGDNNIPAWVISLSLFATFVSSISYLALPGIAYQKNWNSFVFSLSLPVAAIMAVKYFVPQFRKVNSPSAYTFLEIRFGAWARTYAASMYLLTQIMRVGTILFLMALVPSTMFGWNIITIIIATTIVIAVYSMLGGIQAVVWTDALQAIILVAGAIVTVVLIANRIPDGIAGIVSIGIEHDKFSLGSFGFDLSEQSFWVVLLYGTFINLQNFGADQNYIQRYMTSKSLGDAQKSAFWGAILYVPASMIFLFIGTALFALYQSGAAALPVELQGVENGDRVFPYFIAHELPIGITGLLIASIFAAGMSTISTSYNSSATVILTDFYCHGSWGHESRLGELTEKRKLSVLHLSTLVISILGMAVAIAMINTKSALDTWWKLASVFSGGILGLFMLAMFSKIQNSLAVMIGVIAGLALIVWMTLSNLYQSPAAFGNQFHPYLSIVFGTIAIIVVGFTVGLIFKNKK